VFCMAGDREGVPEGPSMGVQIGEALQPGRTRLPEGGIPLKCAA